MQFARRRGRVIAAAVAVCALVALSACGGSGKTAKASATPGKPDAATILTRAASTMEQVKSFHFVLEHEQGSTPITLGPGASVSMTRAEGDVQRPDKLRADIDASALGNLKVHVKLVSVGDAVEISNPFSPGQWQPLPSGTKLSDVFDPGAGTTAALRGVKSPAITGEETVNGVKCWKIDGTVDGGSLTALAPIAEAGHTVKGTAWVAEDNYQVYRIRLDGPLGPQDTPGVIRRIDLSKYNEDISITPVPS